MSPDLKSLLGKLKNKNAKKEAISKEQKKVSKSGLEKEPVLKKEEQKPKGIAKFLSRKKPVLVQKNVQKENPQVKQMQDKTLLSKKPATDEKDFMAAELDVMGKKPPLSKNVVSEKIKIATYGKVNVYKIPGSALLHYEVPVPRPTASEKTIINTIREAATRLISIAPYRIRDPEQRRNVYYNKIIEILRDSSELNIPERRFEFYANSVVREMVGYGLIDDLIRDDKLEEIMVIGPKQPVYIFHREYEMMTTNIEFYDNDEVVDLINRIARGIGRRVDLSNPLLDARLPDGSRVNATIPPASVGGATLTIRKFREDPFTVIDLINYKTLSIEVAAFLWLCVDGLGVKPANVIIAGGTGSGKTTLLNTLATFIPSTERVLSIEDTAELNLPLSHWIRLEAKPPGLEGRGELTMDLLAKNALRMRPDRIIVGEVRHKEAITLFTAMNTGHDGSMGTIHANSSQETLVRITSPPMDVPDLMLSSLDLVIIEHRIHDKKKGTIRRITEIAEITGVLEGKPQVQIIFTRNPIEDALQRTPLPSGFLLRLESLTGMTQEEINSDLKEREKILKNMLDKGIRHITEVARVTEEYVSKKRNVNG